MKRSCSKLLALGALLALPVLAVAQPTPPPHGEEGGEASGWSATTLEELGFDSPRARYAVEPEIGLPFQSRGDRLIVGGKVELRFSEQALDEARGIDGMTILLNQEEVATLSRSELQGRRVLEVDERLFGRSNLLSFRLSTQEEGSCGEVPAGTWRFLESGSVQLRSVQLPVESDLSALPMPWLDRGFDRVAEFHFVFAKAPSREMIRLAAQAAGWLGREGGMPARFHVSVGEIPAAHSIVLVDDEAGAEALALPAPEGPTIRIAAHPGQDPPLHRVLLLAGRSSEELEVVVRRLGAGMAPTSGEVALVEPPPARDPAQPYDASRWLPSDRELRFSELPGGEEFEHRGVRTGTPTLRFRIAPDLFFFPNEFIDLDLDYEVVTPPGSDRPSIDLELNGSFLSHLRSGVPGKRVLRKKLRIHHSLLRGYNELRLHVSYPASTCEEEPGGGSEALVRVLGTSALHLQRAVHFRELPDVPGFIHDGFPFTRISDLGETALVLSADPAPEEIGAALSSISWFASITGDPGSRLEVLSAGELEQAKPDKELLIVARQGAALFRRFAPRLPVASVAGGWGVSVPEQSSAILEWAGGLRERRERERAEDLLATLRSPGLALGMESPFAKGRSVIFITAASAGSLPDAVSLRGDALSQAEGGDLFVVAGDERWSFRIGTTYSSGRLDLFTRVRWVLSRRWLALIPLLFGGAALAALTMRPALERRARRRLSAGEERE